MVFSLDAVIAGFELSLLSIGCILDLLVNKQLSSTLQILRKNNDISSHTNSNNNVNKTVVQRYAFCILVDVAWYCLKCFGIVYATLLHMFYCSQIQNSLSDVTV